MDIEKVVEKTLEKIGLNKKEKIVVALSGGKDSSVVAYFLKKFGYKIQGFHINLGMGKYSEKCLNAVEKLCEDLGIDLIVYHMKKEMGSSMCYIRTGIQSQSKTSGLKNCAICGVLKKSILNKEIRKIKSVKKIATGHNLDDEAQTFLLNIFKGSPELSVNTGVVNKNFENKKFIPRIKPLYYVPEDKIKKFSKKKKLSVYYAKCPCALDSYRIQVRSFLEKVSNKEKQNIIKSFEFLYKSIEKQKDTRIAYCEICGEPSRGKICKRCQLMQVC